MAHTPGPWLIDGLTVYALEPDGYSKGILKYRNRFWASVQSVTFPSAPEEMQANARLIAAAPDLLEALQAVAAYSDSLLTDIEKIVHEAIAKATGNK